MQNTITALWGTTDVSLTYTDEAGVPTVHTFAVAEKVEMSWAYVGGSSTIDLGAVVSGPGAFGDAGWVMESWSAQVANPLVDVASWLGGSDYTASGWTFLTDPASFAPDVVLASQAAFDAALLAQSTAVGVAFAGQFLDPVELDDATNRCPYLNGTIAP